MLHINTIILRNPLHLLFQIIIHTLPLAQELPHFRHIEIHVTGEQHDFEEYMRAVIAPAFREGEVGVFGEGAGGPVAGYLDAVHGGAEVLVVALDLRGC
jgi:hypothetical protein